MLKKYYNLEIYHNQITTVRLPGFNFILYYAEITNQELVIFEHHHDLYEIFYGLTGTAHFIIEGKETELHSHGMLILGKNVPHEFLYYPDSESLYFSIIFDIVPQNNISYPEAESEYQEIQKALAAVDKSHYFVLPEIPHHDVLLARIRETISQKRIGWASQAAMYYYIFVLDLLQQIAENNSVLDTPMGYENVALEATKYIHANLQSNLTLNIVASYLNVTPRHLNRLFQELFGSSFAHTVSTIRLGYAKKYLCNSEKSLDSIAACVGLSSGKALTKLFYEREGISPSLWRKFHHK